MPDDTPLPEPWDVYDDEDAALDPWVAREFGFWDVYDPAPDDEEDPHG